MCNNCHGKTIGLIIFNLLLHYKASGHAAGVSGPVVSMIYIFGIWAAPLLLLLPLITWARLAANGHSFWQTWWSYYVRVDHDGCLVGLWVCTLCRRGVVKQLYLYSGS